MSSRDQEDASNDERNGYHDAHDHHECRDEAGRATGSRHPHDDPGTPPHSRTSASGQRSRDGEISRKERERGALRREVEAADETIEGEILDPPGSERVHAVISQWSGELPHPDDAERYEALQPGTFDRLVRMNERRLSIVEKDQESAATREETIRTAVTAEADVKRELASADTEALKRGQWMSWSISAGSLAIIAFGLAVGQPAALTAVIIPIIQVGAQLVRTVTRDRMESTDRQAVDEPHADLDE